MRLGPLVVSGEIDNTRPYAVCGWLKLRGQEHPITLNLTGDAGEGLKGKRVRFEAAPGGVQIFTPPKLSEALAWQQVGPTGPMTLDRSGLPPHAASLGLTPPASGPTPRRLSSELSSHPNCQRLRLEWDSQNGRVRLDLTGPTITELPSHEEELEELENDGRSDDDDRNDELLGLLRDARDDNEEYDFGFDDEPYGDGELLFDDEDDDPFGLFDPDLQDALDDDADAVDRRAMPELFGGDFGDSEFDD
ncbi:MAG: hypothetical protein AAF907_07950, partial [Planctomycetota bacterium]